MQRFDFCKLTKLRANGQTRDPRLNKEIKNNIMENDSVHQTVLGSLASNVDSMSQSPRPLSDQVIHFFGQAFE